MASFNGLMGGANLFSAVASQHFMDDVDEFRFNLMFLLLQRYSQQGLRLVDVRSAYLQYYVRPKWGLDFAYLAHGLGVTIAEVAGESEEAKTERILTAVLGVEPLKTYFDVRVDEGADAEVPGNRKVWSIRGADEREMKAIALLAGRGHSMSRW